MKKNEMNQEELQSRRDFFKKAVKGALPILGAIVLTGMPNVVKAAETPMGCGEYTCSAGCKNACKGCEYTCKGFCKNACKGCEYTCKGTCKNTCEGTSR